MMKIKCLLPAVLLSLVISSCASFNYKLDRAPVSEESSLIYGYVELDENFNYIEGKEVDPVLVDLSCLPYDMALIYQKYHSQLDPDEELRLDWRNEEEKVLGIAMLDEKGASTDRETGVFAIQVLEGGTHWVYELTITQLTNHQRNLYTTVYTFEPPSELRDAFVLEGGEMVYWGAVKINLIDPESMNAEISAHPTMSRSEVLDRVEELLDGKGWDQWFAEERSRL